MLPFLCVYGWPILLGSLAVLATPSIDSSSWRKPDVALTVAERVSLADAALQRSVSGMSTTTEFLATVYYQMADFDALANRTTYIDVLPGHISDSTKSQEKTVKPEVRQSLTHGYRLPDTWMLIQISDWISVGNAAIRAYTAYKNPVFLELANESWSFARTYTPSETDVASGAIVVKDFALQKTCQGNTMAGGTFETTNTSDPNIAGFASPYFLVLSALMAEATSDSIYVDAAFDSADFLAGHMLSGNLVQSGISGAASDDCALDDVANSFNTGLMIQGLAVLYSVANNASTQALLDNIITATLSNDDWQTANGIITQGGSKMGDKYIVRGLAEAYNRNSTSPDLRPYIEAFLGVQFNAVIDLADSGDGMYAGAWTGPPSPKFSQSNQTTANSALLAALALDDAQKASGASFPTTSSPSPSGTAPPHAQRTPTAPVVGGVVGSIALVAIGLGIWVFLRRRFQTTRRRLASESARPISISTDPTFTTTFVSQSSASASASALSRYQTAPWHITAAPRSPTQRRDSMSKTAPLPTHYHAAQSPISSPSASARHTLAASSVPTLSPVEQLPTTELVRMLNERLRDRRWDEAEVPPEYGTDR
ncbi:hypothetical protein C8R47DRAFT_289586 [Mycena vitilis]|nr:hypothetical protein C8R47DRAFT_289586 [Mycena vitilis]